MKYTMAKLMRKIRGSEGKIEDAKMAIWHASRTIKEKIGSRKGIIGGIALIAGATLGFLLIKKNAKIWPKKKLEAERIEKMGVEGRSLLRHHFLRTVAFISTVSTVLGALARTIKK
jgi:hypothetical protein